VVKDLSFAAKSGELIGLLGPNGAGKTTAIRVLSTILAPTRGSFTLDGVPHTEPREIRRRISVLAESSGYTLHHTGLEYLRYFARLYGYRGTQAKRVAGSLLEEVGLAERASPPVST
jgi:ABC-2 type transport system ATP-binding protein